MDMLESVAITDAAPARTVAPAYEKLRATAAHSTDSAVASVVLAHLPEVVADVTQWSNVLLFNEHYIVKPSKTVSEFRWHRDADLQLAACFAATPYTSVWVPLDDVSVDNGTLTLIPLSDAVSGAQVEAAPDETSPAADPASAITMTLSAGDVVVFDSMVWHRSGPNNSDAFRRVLYAQYSEVAVTTVGPQLAPAADKQVAPICFAVPCAVRKHATQ